MGLKMNRSGVTGVNRVNGPVGPQPGRKNKVFQKSIIYTSFEPEFDADQLSLWSQRLKMHYFRVTGP